MNYPPSEGALWLREAVHALLTEEGFDQWWTQPLHTMIRKHKRAIVLLITTALLGLFFPSCATMRGLGEDISGAGRSLKKAAS
jgi:predicted small secreted protein